MRTTMISTTKLIVRMKKKRSTIQRSNTTPPSLRRVQQAKSLILGEVSQCKVNIGHTLEAAKSLIAAGGILTVADDLLKNDGKKFIEMMEQLAERRMQREEEAQYAAAGLRHPAYGHNHPPIDEEDYDEEDEEDYASDDEEYEDEDEMVCFLCFLPDPKLIYDRRVCRKSNAWKKVAGCSRYLQHACLSSAC